MGVDWQVLYPGSEGERCDAPFPLMRVGNIDVVTVHCVKAKDHESDEHEFVLTWVVKDS